MDAEIDSLFVDLSASDLPADWQIEQADTPSAEPLPNVRAEIEAQLSNPLASLPLVDICSAGTTVVIVCDDAPGLDTRFLILNGVLAHLERAGVDPDKITLLIAARSGADAADLMQPSPIVRPVAGLSGYAGRIHLVRHDPGDVRELDELGNFEGVPLTINYRAAGADLLIAISVMVLEDDVFDAGRAGSCATVTLGVAGSATRREVRTTRFYDDRVEASGYDRPLFDRVMREGARRAGLVFAIDALEDEAGCALAVRAGAPNAVNDALNERAMSLREARVFSSAYDVVLADAGAARSTNLFDASRAAINVGLSGNSVLMRGGSLILPISPAGQLEDGIGDSVPARTFYDALTNASSPEFVIEQLQGRSLDSAEARAYLLARVMERHHVIAAGAQKEQLARDSHFLSSPSVREAAELAENFVGKRPRALIVRHALRTISAFNGLFGNSDALDDTPIELPRLN